MYDAVHALHKLHIRTGLSRHRQPKVPRFPLHFACPWTREEAWYQV